MSRRVNLIPAAGAGARFVEAGYATPKPLLPVDGEPMIVRAARALPPRRAAAGRRFRAVRLSPFPR